MNRRVFGWMLLLLGAFSPGAAAADTCTYTPSPAGWRALGDVNYRLVMDHTWLFVPTGRIQIQPSSSTFAAGGRVQVFANASTSPLPLFADPDLHSSKGTEPTYSAGSGSLDYWFWANFQPGTASVDLKHTIGTSTTAVPVNWTVNVQCAGAGGLQVAPDGAFNVSGNVGGPFQPSTATYGLTNSGASTLGYTVSVAYPPASATGWLSLSPSSGSLGAGQSSNFAATVNSSANGLATGTYGATIEVRTTGANPQTITRPVSLTVQAGPSLPPAISGRITTSDDAPLEGVRMDGLPSVQWTRANGDYSVFVGTGWSGTVRPFKAGFTFSPANRAYVSVTAGFTLQDYVGTATTHTMSGRVTLNGQGLPGVAMTGLPGNPVTGGDGSYSAVLPFNWSGTVIPSATGHAFSPASMTYSLVGMNRVDENYLASLQTVTLSGRVTSGSSGLGGVWLNGLPGSVVTASDGTYAAALPYGASGTLTPQANGYVFSPPSSGFTNLTQNLPAQNFVASSAPAGSGRLWIVATSAALTHATIVSLPGDMILVKPGTYLDVNVGGLDPGTILVSEAGADQTILEVLQFVVNMSDVVIEGFTFRTTGSFEPLHVTGSSNVRLRNCRFVAPTGAYGVRITNAQNLLIEGSVFSGNGGILLRSGTSTGTLTLRNNHFLTQSTGVTGGNNPSLQVILENNLFRNIAQSAFDVDRISSLVTRNNLFVGNGKGLDIASMTGSVQLSHDTLVGNGTAYDISGTISLVIFNSILQGNNRGIDGEGNATISVHHLMHWQNTAWLYNSAHYILDEATIWESDPRFVSVSSGDYRLASGSPARGTGQGGADLGAYGGTLGSAWKTPPGAPPTPPALLSLAVTGQDRMSPGDLVTLEAKAAYERGYLSPYSTFNDVAQWSSSDATVLESQGAGRFRAVRPGNATVTARSGSVSTTLPVHVLAPALSLTVADTADPVSPGGTVTYELVISNLGEGVARNLQVTAQLDARTSFVSATPPPDTGTSNRWTLAELQPGQSRVISLTLNVIPGAAGATLSFSASATADFATTASGNEQTSVSGTPDLQIGASLSSAQIRPGQSLSATLTFRNAGSAPAENGVVEVVYPSGLSFLSAVPSPSSGTGVWFVGTLAPGDQRTLSINLQAAPSASGTLVFAAEIRNSGDEATPADNRATASLDILPVADLEVSTTDSPDPGRVGQTLVYTTTVTNRGPSTATGVALQANLPAGLNLLSVAPDQGTCGGVSPVACQLGSLPANASTRIVLSASPTAAGSLQMSATVSGNEEDPVASNNLITATTQILAPSTQGFYTLTPCRLLDTRSSVPLGTQVRLVPVAGRCGVPATARAVALNVTVVSATGIGQVAVWAADRPLPVTRVIYFGTGQIRANNAIASLSTDGGGNLAAQAFVAGSGTVQLILDVSGYFQ